MQVCSVRVEGKNMPHPSDRLITDLTLPDPRSMLTDDKYQKLTETCCGPHFKLPLDLGGPEGEHRFYKHILRLQAQDLHKAAHEEMYCL